VSFESSIAVPLRRLPRNSSRKVNPSIAFAHLHAPDTSCAVLSPEGWRLLIDCNLNKLLQLVIDHRCGFRPTNNWISLAHGCRSPHHVPRIALSV
jgi:hypothetical protein